MAESKPSKADKVYAYRSASQIQAYSDCSERWRLERRTNVPSRPAAWFAHGKAVHSAIEHWEDDQRETSMEELESVYLTAYRTEINTLLEKFDQEWQWMTGGFKKGFQDMEDREGLGWWQVQDYIAFATEEQDYWRVKDSEVEFTITLGGVEVTGFIDQVLELVGGALIPADLKTGSKLPASNLQLAIYREAIQEIYGVEVNSGCWVWLGRPPKGRSKGRETRREVVDFTEDSLGNREALEQIVYDMNRSEAAGIYLPNPTESCERTCGVAQWCRSKGDPTSAFSKQALQGLKLIGENPWD